MTVYSVKVVKKEPKMSLTPPRIRILDSQEDWQILNQDDARWQGENLWEIYFNIGTDEEKPCMPRVEIAFEGIEPARTIVGSSDVPYEYDDGKVAFTMIDDRSVGQLIQTLWRGPRGGLPIHLIHNWEMRKVGPWTPWPANAIHAVDNFLFAAREAIGLMSEELPDKDRYDGNIVLMGFETSSSRGHKDNPPHVHIMLYVPGYSPGSCVPHLYVNDRGEIYSNSYVKIGVPGSDREFGCGELCTMQDLGGKTGLEIMITQDGGLMLRANPEARKYYLKPHKSGGHRRVSVYSEEELVCDASTVDQVSTGKMAATITYPTETYTEDILYDPFTGRLLHE